MNPNPESKIIQRIYPTFILPILTTIPNLNNSQKTLSQCTLDMLRPNRVYPTS